MTKTVLFVVSSHHQIEGTDKKTGFNLIELVKPCNFFKQHGYQAELASIKGGKVCPEPESVKKDDPEINQFLEQCCGQFENSRPLNQFNPDQYCAVYFVGGFGAMWDFCDPSVCHFLCEFYKKGGVVGAVCHGPMALTVLKDENGEPLIRGKTVTGFTNEEESGMDYVNYYPECEKTHAKTLEDNLRAIGANFVKGDPHSEFVVHDNRIVTGQNPASAVAVANQMVEVIEQCKSHGK